MAGLQVDLLGQFRVAWGGRPVDLNGGAARLLAYLALSRDRLIPRSRIAGTLWADLPENRARANLSTVMWRLQSALSKQGCPANILWGTTASLGLNASVCEVDVKAFQQDSMGDGTRPLSIDGLARAVRAADLYKGDLLEEWDLDWCLLEREHLRQRYLCTLKGLAEGFERLRRYDLALQFARRAAHTDPLNEPAQRTLMRLLCLTGDRVSAINQFNRFASKARSELGVEPGAEMLSLLDQIKSSEAGHGVSENAEHGGLPLIVAQKVPIVGRIAERQRISTLLDVAMSGAGGGLMVLGEAGVGKSRLAEWAMEEWAARGGSAALGRCIEFNAPVPYQPILDSLGSIAGIEDLLCIGGQEGKGESRPAPSQLSSGEDPEGNNTGNSGSPGKLRFFSRLRAKLIATANRRPVLIVVEDLQWADAGSVDLLAFILDRVKDTRIAILLTSRPGGSKVHHVSSLERLSRHCTDAMQIAPLTNAETRELVKSLLSTQGITPGIAEWVHTETEGNPLFVIETLRLLQQQGKTLRDARELARLFQERTQPDWDFDIPNGVRSAVRQRLALISPASQRVAGIASVLGRGFDEELLTVVAGTDANRLSKAVAELLRAGVIERDTAGYRFAHDKIRAVCYEDLQLRVKRAYHTRAASALIQFPDVPDYRIAWHQLSAGQWSLACASWERAGDQAREIYAYEDALKAYGYAVYCNRREGARVTQAKTIAEVGFLLKQEDVLAILGRPSDRITILERIGFLSKQVPAASARATWLARCARLEEHVGNFGLAAKLARKAWADARLAGEQSVQAESLRILAWALNRAGRYHRSLAVSQLALRKLAGANSPLAVTVLWQAAGACIWLGDYPAASSFLERARTVSAGLGLLNENPLILITQAILDKWSGDVLAARSAHLKAMRVAEEAGDPLIATRATVSLASLDSLEGRLGDALRRLRKAIVASRSVAYKRFEVACLNEVANGVGRLLGNYGWAWDACNHALRLAKTSDSRIVFAMCRDTQAQMLLEEGRLDEARVAVVEALQSLDSVHPETLARRGVICLHLGRVPEAISVLEEALRVQLKTGERLMLADTLTHLALAHAKQGDADRAISTSDDAVRVLAEIGYANLQPQRIFWHHFLILEMFNREPRIPFLRRAVEFIDERGSTLSKAQQRRFRRDVPLNREILAAWQRCQQAAAPADPSAGHESAPTLLPLAVRAT